MNSFKERVNFPNQLNEGIGIESHIVNSIDKYGGVAASSSKGKDQYILRLYYLIKGEERVEN